MKFMLAHLFSLLLVALFASPTWAKTGSCKLESATVLKLSGSTDVKMLSCVRSKNLAGVKTIKVNSAGGSVSDALEIGDLLAPLGAEFIITKQCSSSCANFFLPIARKITLRKNAHIILHGSIDSGIARKVIRDTPTGTGVDFWEVVELQQYYAEKYDIHRGWLMYRETYENGGGGRFDYVSGNLDWLENSGTVKMIMVEEHMLRSCLKNVEITPFVDTRIDRARVSKKKKRKLIKHGIRPSGTWACIGPGSASLPPPDFAALRAESNLPININKY